MRKQEIARKLIYNFLQANPGKKPIDFLKEKRSLFYTTCFNWVHTPEGPLFWRNFYCDVCHGMDSEVNTFLKKYFFDTEKRSNFINLSNFV